MDEKAQHDLNSLLPHEPSQSPDGGRQLQQADAERGYADAVLLDLLCHRPPAAEAGDVRRGKPAGELADDRGRAADFEVRDEEQDALHPAASTRAS